ncbi:MAG: hypothetical protein GX235_03060 [Clostridiales bacterium]|nr:hypothetical protein [Clostridiales bacterium]
MERFNQGDFIDSQYSQPPRNPPPPFPGGFRPGSGPGGSPGDTFGNAPRTAPPNYTPSRQMTTFRVDSSSIRNCLGNFTYVWLNNGNEFWMFPIQVSRNTVSGFRWNRFFGWSFFGLSLNRIDAFMCV